MIILDIFQFTHSLEYTSKKKSMQIENFKNQKKICFTLENST